MSNNFKTRSTQANRIQRRKKRQGYTQKRESTFSFGKFLTRLLGIFVILWVLGFLFIWGLYIKNAPNVSLIEKRWYFQESTVYYDAKWWELYRESDKGTLEYKTYGEISQSIKDALISTEDKWFFENPWVDFQGLVRAGLNYITGKTNSVRGTSTLSQQLIKNTLLTNERSIKRKVQEAYLAYELNKRYSKEKILEMYLNAIEFGHNAIGVEQASKNFFGKSAKDVGPLGATILASLPKSPTYYSPYSHRDRLMGKIEAFPTNQKAFPESKKNSKITLNLQTANGKFASIYVPFREYIKQIKFSRDGNNVKACNLRNTNTDISQFRIDSQGCTTFEFDKLLNFLGSTHIEGVIRNEEEENEKYTLEYTIWRKDFVAYRMFEDKKIDGKTFGKIWADGLEFQFQKVKHTIKYPYFVMMVKEYLEKKYEKEDLNIKQGLKIYTTIEPTLQDEAEKIVFNHVQQNKKLRGANSAALVSMDNKTGKLLALVGWPDYFDTKNGGNNNMATAYRQPGSSFKPLVYALAISKNPIGNNTPVADVETKFGGWTPNNHDNKWEGIQSLAYALGHSRNIPAVKMYYLAEQEEKIKKDLTKFGITGFGENYGAPMALGTSEVRPIDLMQAYSVLANNGIKRDMYFIQKIEDSNGGIIFEHTNKEKEILLTSTKKETNLPAAAYITSLMLSNRDAIPNITEWKNNLNIGRTVAGKTGTANKPAKRGSKLIFPGDLWMAGYTPQITTVVWAGNVDGSATKRNCFGLNCAAPIWNKFMRFAHKDLKREEFKKPKNIFHYTISKLNGRLATESTADSDKVETFTAVKLTLKDAGFKEIQMDEYCGGPATEFTPKDGIVLRKIPSSPPIIDGFDPSWKKDFFKALDTSGSLSSSSNINCNRPAWLGQVQVSAAMVGLSKNILQISWNGNRKIKTAIISENGKILKTTPYGNPQSNANDRINLSRVWNINKIGITLIDEYGYRYDKTLEIQKDPKEVLEKIGEKIKNNPNAIPPKILLINPKRNSINLYKWSPFNLRFNTFIHTDTKSITVALDGKVIQSANKGSVFVIPVSTENIDIGTHTVTITATDANKKSAVKTFTLNVLQQ